MGLIAEKWKCQKCNVDVGGAGELKNRMKKIHPARFETRFADAA